MKKKIEEICIKTAEKLKDPDYISTIAFKEENRFINKTLAPWDLISMDYGCAGLVVLFSEMDDFFPSQGWDKICHNYISLLIKGMKSNGYPHFSIFSGLTGICFAIQLAAKKYSVLTKLDLNLYQFLLENIHKHYLKPIEEAEKHDKMPYPFQFDATSGLSCFLSYLVNYKHLEEAKNAIYQILRHLVRVSSYINVNSNKIPGWYMSIKDPNVNKIFPDFLLNHFLKMYPNGFFEVGIAHGISGCLAALAKALLNGIEIEGQREAMNSIINWLITTRQNVGKIKQVWPRRFGFNAEKSNFVEVPPDPYFDAWSIGSPGVLSSIILAADALKNENLSSYCIEDLKKVIDRNNSHKTINGLPLCYGWSGIMTIMHQASLITGKKVLLEETKICAKNIIDQYSEDHPFGFKCSSPSNDLDEDIIIDNPGLITGSAGILLSLLFILSKKQKTWTSILLLN